MKKLLIALSFLLFSTAVSAQMIELRNNTSQTLDITVAVYSGGSIFISGVVSLPASGWLQPVDVDTWWGPGLPTNTSYVIGCSVTTTACVDNFNLDATNTSYNACTGTPDAFRSDFDFDSSTRDLILHNN